MAKSKEKREKIYFIKTPPGTGYHFGMTENVPQGKADEFKKKGFARTATEVLPDDFPYRDELIKAGLDTKDEVKDFAESKHTNLTDIDGIGEVGKAKIRKAVGLDEEEESEEEAESEGEEEETE